MRCIAALCKPGSTETTKVDAQECGFDSVISAPAKDRSLLAAELDIKKEAAAIAARPVTGEKDSQTNACPLKHGTVYAAPYPGYVHGRYPAICKFGCKPMVRPFTNETPREQMVREAREFQEMLHHERSSPAGELEKRWSEIEREIAVKGTYTHTHTELQVGAALAWRNASKCANRKFWNTIEVYDRRDVRTNQGMFDACVEHLTQVAKEGVTKVRMTVFQPTDPSTGKNPRFWSEQLTRFAAFYDGDKIVGDPANLAFTDMLRTHFKWTPQDKSPFQPLPILLQNVNKEPELFNLPESCSIMVDIWHPNYPFLAELGMRWTGVPALLGFVMELGGLSYPAIPFNGWFADTEIVRDLADADRYNMLPVIAKGLGLATENESSLWKDEALFVLMQAIMHSYKHADVAMVDHHTMLAAFWIWYHDEMRVRGWCPGNWKWIIPPVAGATCQAYMGLNKMTDYTLKPLYKNGPGWRKYVVETFGEQGAEVGLKKLGIATRVVWAASKLLLKVRKSRVKVMLVYSSSNGTTKTFAESASALLRTHCEVTLMDSKTITPLDHQTFDWQFQLCDAFIMMTASYGRGDPPEEGVGFYKYLQSESFQTRGSKPFAVLGFGNSEFPDFCGAATKFDAALSAKGCKQLCPVVRCDELKARQATFDKWLDDIVPFLCKLSKVPIKMVSSSTARRASKGMTKETNAGPLVELDFAAKDERPVDRLLEKECSMQEYRRTARDFMFDASVVSIDAIEGQKESWAGSMEPGVALTKLALKDKVPYKVGDHIAIVPCGMQFEDCIDDLCKALNVDPDAVFVARPAGGQKLEKHVAPVLYAIQRKYTTMRIVFRTAAALGEPVSATVCAILAGYAEDTKEASLLHLASSDAEFHATMCKDGGMRWADLFKSFKSLAGQVPLEVFLMLLPTHRTRLYSIASSPANSPKEVDLIVSRHFMGDGNDRHKGVASDDLSVLPAGSRLQFQVKTCRDFHLPADPRAPLVLIGAGSGLAPFRGFWQERMAAIKSGQRLGPAALVYGCRDELGMMLNKELIEAQACGAVTLLITAISSRLPKRYVQDHIAEDKEALKHFLDHPKCEVFLCGSTSMVQAATKALSAGSDAWLHKLQSQGRWHEDCFGGSNI